MRGTQDTSRAPTSVAGTPRVSARWAGPASRRRSRRPHCSTGPSTGQGSGRRRQPGSGPDRSPDSGSLFHADSQSGCCGPSASPSALERSFLPVLFRPSSTMRATTCRPTVTGTGGRRPRGPHARRTRVRGGPCGLGAPRVQPALRATRSHATRCTHISLCVFQQATDYFLKTFFKRHRIKKKTG